MTKQTILLLATATLALAACSKKRPAVLPPAPTEGVSQEVGPGGQTGDASGAIVPGSDGDFRRSVQSNTVLFGLDQYDIDPTARAVLDSQAEWLQRNPNVRITVEGHCDERGTREYNLALGDRRANAAKNYLAARGVSPARMTTISYGSERPAETGSDEQAYAANRRAVTIVVS